MDFLPETVRGADPADADETEGPAAGRAGARRSYTVRYSRRDAAGWLVSVAELPWFLGGGRTISVARARVRELLGAIEEHARPDDIEIVDDVQMSGESLRKLRVAWEARARAEGAAKAAAEATREAVAALMVGEGMSVRDAAEIVGAPVEEVVRIAGEGEGRCVRGGDGR